MTDSILKIFSAIAIVLFTVAILSFPVQFLWNQCLVGSIDGFNSISLFEALGINLLTSILFKNSLSNDKKSN